MRLTLIKKIFINGGKDKIIEKFNNFHLKIQLEDDKNNPFLYSVMGEEQDKEIIKNYVNQIE